MFINYILTAWRSLLKNRAISIINIGGLTIGLASAVMAILFAHHELSFEICHEKADRICRVYTKGDFDKIQWVPTVFGPEGSTFKRMFPEVEEYTRSMELGNLLVRVGENKFYEENGYAADSNYFKILTFPFILGGSSNELCSVVISESIAQRYFGVSNPLGKNMNLSFYGKKIDFVVTGVYKNLPSNTHLVVDFIIPFNNVKLYDGQKPDEYNNSAFTTYLLLRKGADYKELNKKIDASFKIPIDIANIGSFLIPLKEIHMRGTWSNNKAKLIAFLFGGFFVLIITSLNYINLTNILFSTRNKEIGIRKVNGARQKHIFLQFLTDTLLSTLIAFNLAIILIKLALPWFNTLMDTKISIDPSINSMLLMALIFIATIILSGLYPALRYSFLKPVTLMKPVANSLGGKGYSRRILTTFQFFLAIVFIQFIMAMTVHGRFLGSDNYKHYNSNDVLCITGDPWGDLNKVKDELLKSPSVKAITWGSTLPEMGGSLTMEWKEKDNKTVASIYQFDQDYLKVFKIAMLEGHFFSKNFPSELEQGVVINKLTAGLLGYDEPVGKQVLVRGKYYKIIGVIDQYRAVPPIFDHFPMLILTGETLSNYLAIRIDPTHREEANKFIKKTLKSFNPEIPIEFNYHSDFLTDNKEAKSFISTSKLMNLFFILTIITSLVGLFGLSLFIAQRHRREVGIRKVFGAPIANIMLRLSKGLIIQVLIAVGLATPLSMVMVTGYLSVFPSKFHLGLPFYLLGGLAGLLLVLITVGWQTWRAAMANPTNSLRCE
jgi:ABC-type antimicrobial peptide transport system permease subunit